MLTQSEHLIRRKPLATNAGKDYGKEHHLVDRTENPYFLNLFKKSSM